MYFHYGMAVSPIGFQYMHYLHKNEEYLQECEGKGILVLHFYSVAAITW